MTADRRASKGIVRGPPIRFSFDGREFEAHDGETVAAALLAAGVRVLRRGSEGGARGVFCAMGACQECVVEVDGRRQEACRIAVREGLQVRMIGTGEKP